MDEDGGGAGEDVVGVDVGDGEVAHVAQAGPGLDRDDHGRGAVAVPHAQRRTGLEVRRVRPLLRGGVPERVVPGGVQDGGRAVLRPDGDVGEVGVMVVVQELDLLGGALAGGGIGGQDSVAGLDVLDRLGGAVGHQDSGGRVETVRAGGGAAGAALAGGHGLAAAPASAAGLDGRGGVPGQGAGALVGRAGGGVVERSRAEAGGDRFQGRAEQLAAEGGQQLPARRAEQAARGAGQRADADGARRAAQGPLADRGGHPVGDRGADRSGQRPAGDRADDRADAGGGRAEHGLAAHEHRGARDEGHDVGGVVLDEGDDGGADVLVGGHVGVRGRLERRRGVLDRVDDRVLDRLQGLLRLVGHVRDRGGGPLLGLLVRVLDLAGPGAHRVFRVVDLCGNPLFRRLDLLLGGGDVRLRDRGDVVVYVPEGLHRVLHGLHDGPHDRVRGDGVHHVLHKQADGAVDGGRGDGVYHGLDVAAEVEEAAAVAGRVGGDQRVVAVVGEPVGPGGVRARVVGRGVAAVELAGGRVVPARGHVDLAGGGARPAGLVAEVAGRPGPGSGDDVAERVVGG